MNQTPRNMQAVVIAFLSIGVVVLALSGYLTPLASFALNPFISVQTWISTRYQAVRDLLTSPSDITQLRQRVADLEAENASLQGQVLDLQDQLEELPVLSALVDFEQANPENKYLSAAVIAYDPSPFMRYVIINRGSDDELRRGMPVVTSQGLVGRITAVTAVAARVQLITDPGSNINIQLRPSQAEAVLTGTLTGEVDLEQIPQNANVQPGDLVLTSGLGGNFPPGVIIGQVTGVRSHDYELFQSASVQPVVDFSKLEIVLVIVNFNTVDITPLVP
jgi:rod shape-determining protein MreC